MAVAGAHGVAVDAAGADVRSPAPLDGVIQADDDGLPLFDQLRHQEPGEPSCEAAVVPASAVEAPVTGGMVGVHRPAGDAQAGGHGAFAGCRQGAHDEHENEAPGRGCEYASKRFKPDAQDIRNRIAGDRRQGRTRSCHDVAGSSPSTAIMAASTASLSPAGRAS